MPYQIYDILSIEFEMYSITFCVCTNNVIISNVFFNTSGINDTVSDTNDILHSEIIVILLIRAEIDSFL